MLGRRDSESFKITIKIKLKDLSSKDACATWCWSCWELQDHWYHLQGSCDGICPGRWFLTTRQRWTHLVDLTNCLGWLEADCKWRHCDWLKMALGEIGLRKITRTVIGRIDEQWAGFCHVTIQLWVNFDKCGSFMLIKTPALQHKIMKSSRTLFRASEAVAI